MADMLKEGDLVKVLDDPTGSGYYLITVHHAGKQHDEPVTHYAGRVGRIKGGIDDLTYIVEVNEGHSIYVPYYSLEKLDHA